MRLIFVRHGETVHNVALVITSGFPGNDLTERGVMQIQTTANALRDALPVAVYTSPLRRARQSAEIVADALYLPVHQDDGFRECDVGDLEGRGSDADFARFNEAMDRWYLDADLDFPLGTGGETPRDALARARAAIARIQAAHTPEQTVVVVSHQTLLQLVLTFLSDNLTPPFGHRRWITNAGASVVDVDEDGSTCVEWDGRAVSNLLAESEGHAS